jgi:hypothetical protein
MSTATQITLDPSASAGPQRVVSWEDGFKSLKVGSHIDGKYCVVLNPGRFVVSWEDGYQTCKIGNIIDGTNCLILTV